MPIAVKTWLRFLLLSSALLIPAILIWHSGNDQLSLWPVIESDRGWYGTLLSAFVRRPHLDLFMFYADIPLLFVVVIAATRMGVSARLAAAFGALGFVALTLFQGYHQLSWRLQHQPPLMVADSALLAAAQHFVEDLGTEWLVALGVGVGFGVLLAFAMGVRLLSGLIRDSRQSLAPYLVSLGLVAYAASLTIMVGAHRSDTVGKWLAKELYDNISRSRAHQDLTAQLEQLPSDERYHDLLSEPAKKTPNVLIYVMESYGDILLTDSRLRSRFAGLLSGAEQRLTAEGWHLAHNLSTSPVHGGKSKLSSATMLTGVKIAYPSHYQRFMAMSGDYPHLIRWLAASGYETYGVHPAHKPRPDLPETNTYDFDHYLTSRQLPYEGQAFGWAQMPDQFALGHAITQLKELRSPGAPQFMLYNGVSSHSPWREPPAFTSDWRQAGKQPTAETVGAKQQVMNALNFRLKSSLGHEQMAAHYLDQITYQWQVITDLAAAADSPFDLIIVIGDHQPPLLSGKDAKSFDTPVHVLAKDQQLIRPLIQGGFVGGSRQILAANPIRHEGIYQLIADLLQGKSRDVAAGPWRQGAGLGALKF